MLQNFEIIPPSRSERVLVLAGDHVYKMDYGRMLAAHVENDADVTVGCIEVPVAEASAIRRDGGRPLRDARGQEFAEKPAASRVDARQKPDVALASMGIYVFSTSPRLYEELEARPRALPDSTHDFGRDIIPVAVEPPHASTLIRSRTRAPGQQALLARYQATLDSYWQANMELMGVAPELNPYDAGVADLDLAAAGATRQVRVRRR